MEKHTTDLLRRRVKLGAQTDALFAQLVEVLRELRKVHAEISRELTQEDVNRYIPNVIGNFQRIMVTRLETAIKALPSSSEQSLEEIFTKENIDIASRLEAPIRPKESLVEYNTRIGNTVRKGRS